jgi:hypothetical protein
MATPITVSIPHQLGRAEARRRIDGGFSNIVQLLPVRGAVSSQRWEDDRLTFAVPVLGQMVSGVIDVLDNEVRMQIDVPGVVGMIAGGLRDRLQKAGQLLLTRK